MNDDRRSFLKKAALAAGAIALPGMATKGVVTIKIPDQAALIKKAIQRGQEEKLYDSLIDRLVEFRQELNKLCVSLHRRRITVSPRMDRAICWWRNRPDSILYDGKKMRTSVGGRLFGFDIIGVDRFNVFGDIGYAITDRG